MILLISLGICCIGDALQLNKLRFAQGPLGEAYHMCFIELSRKQNFCVWTWKCDRELQFLKKTAQPTILASTSEFRTTLFRGKKNMPLKCTKHKSTLLSCVCALVCVCLLCACSMCAFLWCVLCVYVYVYEGVSVCMNVCGVCVYVCVMVSVLFQKRGYMMQGTIYVTRVSDKRDFSCKSLS